MDIIEKQSTFPQTERMDSIGKDCTPLKHKYDDCFNKWYSEQFLNGNWTTPNGQPCAELFAEYKSCVVVGFALCLCRCCIIDFSYLILNYLLDLVLLFNYC